MLINGSINPFPETDSVVHNSDQNKSVERQMNFSQDLCVIAVDLSHFTPCHADCMTDRQTNVDLTLDSDLRETAAGLMKWQHHDSCLSKAPRLQLRPVVNHISTKLIVKQT